MSLAGKFSREIYLSRKNLVLTQERAAELLGISLRWYQKIENGKALPSSELTLRIIAYFGIDGTKLREENSIMLNLIV